jgi:hypothetical protein
MTLLKAFFGLGLSMDDLPLWKACTGRREPPRGAFKELWAIVGRRGGKSFMAAVVAVFLGLFFDFTKYLSPGEFGTIMIVAADRSQGQVLFRYVKGILNSNRVFKQYIANELAESIELTNRIRIEVMSASYRSIRGRTVVAAVFDEISFWHREGVSPDKEILAAARPSMATIPTSRLIVISSPYARSGVLFEHHRDYYGKDDQDQILIWQAPTRVMNPTIDAGLIERETKKDPTAARAEWDAQFREDIEDFLSIEAIEAVCVLPGSLAPDQGCSYSGFVDPSGGRADAMTLCVGHHKDGRTVVDCLRAWQPPFNPNSVVKDIAGILKEYRISFCTGDKYAANFVSDSFKEHGITYNPCDKNKSDLYLNLEGIINTSQIELPDSKKLKSELVSLERQRGRSGKDINDHPPRGHDDRANAVAGLSYIVARRSDKIFKFLRCGI